jgi:hypothetical protein
MKLNPQLPIRLMSTKFQILWLVRREFQVTFSDHLGYSRIQLVHDQVAMPGSPELNAIDKAMFS